MPAEGFATEFQTTVSSLIGSTDTTFNLTSTAGLPASPTQFRLRLEPAGGSLAQYELVVCQIASGTTVTTVGTRAAAQEGTTGQSWAVGSLCSQVITAGGLSSLTTSLTSIFGVGGAMIGSPPALTAARFLIQAGNDVHAVSVNGVFSINYPVPFPGGVVAVIVTPDDLLTNVLVLTLAQTMSTTAYFQGYARNGSGVAYNATNIRIHWIAIGW